MTEKEEERSVNTETTGEWWVPDARDDSNVGGRDLEEGEVVGRPGDGGVAGQVGGDLEESDA